MKPADLEWWQWLLYSSAELTYLGHYPDERLLHTGHKRALHHRWSLTLGLWGWSSAESIRRAASATWAQYWSFKRHWKTKTTRSTKSRHVPIISLAHANTLLVIGDGKDEGRAAAEVAPKIGILPIEALLYYRAVKTTLEAKGLTPTQFYNPERFDGAELYSMISSTKADLCLPWPVFDKIARLLDEKTANLHRALSS